MNFDEIKGNVFQAFETGDVTQLQRVVQQMPYFRGEQFNDMVNMISNLEMPLYNKLKICMTIACMDIRTFFSVEIMSAVINRLIKENEEQFLKLITENEDIQKLCVQCYKNIGELELGNNIEHILMLPDFRKNVLEDEDFISEKMVRRRDFFRCLPKEYAYLISFYNSDMDFGTSTLRKYYQKYFSECLTNKEQMELAELQHDISIDNYLNLSQKDIMRDIKYVLQQILRDRKFYDNIQNIRGKAVLDLKGAISFAQKYDGTEFYEQLLNDECNVFDDDILQKIYYLANKGRVKEPEKLKDIRNVTMQELENMPKDNYYVSRTFLAGGPLSEMNNVRIFEDSTNREIRRIDKNGEVKIVIIPGDRGHDDGVKEIYGDDVKFPKECLTAIERSMEAAKQISSMTYVIENEHCFIIVPDNVSIEQKKISIDWLSTALQEGVIGIFVYDRNKDELYVANAGDEMNIQDATDFMFNLNGKMTPAEMSKIEISKRSSNCEKDISMMQLAKKSLTENVTNTMMAKMEQQLGNVEKQEIHECTNEQHKGEQID